MICGFLHLCAAQNILGQPQVDYSSKLPEVTKMQKNIEVPISLFTGEASVSIPLYTLKSKAITVPITLDYRTGGIKADEVAGMFGIGWTLNAGGSITRSVRGNEDEGMRFNTRPRKYQQFVQGQPPYFYKWDTDRDSIINLTNKYGGFYLDNGNIGHSASLFHSTFTSHNQTLSENGIVPDYNTLPFFNNGLSDGEPDVFYYNFGSRSGKFILSPEPVLIPYTEDIKIVPEIKMIFDTTINSFLNDTAIFKQFYFNSFKISTPEGVDYYFGESDGAKIETITWSKRNTFNGWMLTRIIDRIAGDTVLFEYQGRTGHNVSMMEHKQNFVKNDGHGCPSPLVFGRLNSPGSKGVLAAIKTNSISVNVGNRIEVRDRASQDLYQVVQMALEPLNSGRPALKGILNVDKKTNKASSYTFDYYQGSPYMGATAQDFWGFHNGANNGTSMLLGYPGCTTGGANRNASWPAMQVDALVAVNYPNGGKTMIEYEPHDAYEGRNLSNTIVESDAYFVGQNLNFSLTAPASIGGLRVKRIMQYDPLSGDSLIKSVSYKRFGTNISSGLLHIPPSLNIDYASLSCGPNASNPLYLRSSQNMYKGDGTGKLITYNKVTVMEQKNGVNNGYTEFEYFDDRNTDSSFYSNAISATSNFSTNDQYNVYPSTQFKLLPENFLSSREKEKRIFTQDGKMVEKVTSSYQSNVHSYITASVFNSVYKKDACSVQLPVSGSIGVNKKAIWAFIDDLYEIYASHGTYLYSSNDDTEDDVPFQGNGGYRPILPPPYSFYYMFRYSIPKMSVLPAKSIRNVYQTPAIYVSDTTIYEYDNPAHINATRIVNRDSKGNVITRQVLYPLDFTSVNNGDSTIYFMKKASFNTPLADFVYSNNMITDGGFRNYALKSRQDSASFQVKVDYKLTAGAQGITPAAINLQAGYPKPFNFNSNLFRKIMSYSYNPNNTLSFITKMGGEKKSFIWDYNKSLVVAEAPDVDSSDIAYSSFETPTDGNWSVTGQSRNSSLYFTGKKSYNLSSGAVIKNGLNAAKAYTVSYWSNTNTSASVNGTSATAELEKNGWYYYVHKLAPGAGTVSVSGSSHIDELRLYPHNAHFTTRTFDPVTGVTSSNSPGTTINFYNYDGYGRLMTIRDINKNIIQATDYSHRLHSVFSDYANPRYVYTGNYLQKKCTADTNFFAPVQLREFRDFNINSPSFDQVTWLEINCTDCVVTAWRATSTPTRCQKDGSNQNTGYVEQEHIDLNPCSPTYNQLRWIKFVGANTSSCPLPPPPCQGEDKMLINGQCVTGTKVITAAIYVSSMGQWSCTYHYEWLPDCIRSADYVEYRNTPCSPGGTCNPL